MLNRSCNRCRGRKIRCDGETPCSNCRIKGLDEECSQVARKVRSRKASTSKSYPTMMEEQEESSSIAADAEHSDNIQDQSTLLNLAKEALGDAHVCTDLIREIFFWKVQSVVHASIDMRSVLQQVKLIFNQDSASSVESDSIVLCMMVVALSLQYIPKHNVPLNLVERIKSIDRTIGPRLRQNLLFELSSSYACHQMNHRENHDFTFIQILILFLIYDQHEETLRDQIFHQAVNHSFRIGLHCINKYDGNQFNEFKVRTWWFLVSRSWMTSLSNITSMIRSHQFTTRLPVERADLDTHPTDTSTHSSVIYFSSWYSITMIRFADLIRRLVDYRLTGSSDIDNVVQEQFEDFMEQLPLIYQITTSTTEMDVNTDDNIAKIIAERCIAEQWLIYQQAFHAYLEFQHLEPTEPIPEACLYLAHHTIDLQGSVSNKCHVLDSFRFNVSTIIKAVSVSVLYLMQGQVKSRIARSILLKKGIEATRKCDSTLANANEFDQINEMIELESKMWHQSRHDTSSTFTNHTNPPVTSTYTVHQQQTTRQQEQEQEQMQMDWSTFMPSDAGVFPVFQSNTNNLEWTRLYDMFLESNDA